MRAAKRDTNHHAIVQALERCGVVVVDLAAHGKSVPDLLCYRTATGLLRLIEVKSKRGQLSKGQQEFARRVPVWIVRSVEDALAAMEIQVAQP